jgi:1,2-diacylglycerol 3-alpha-glucosyltransferase
MTSYNLRVLMLSDVYFPRINGVSTSIETFRTDLANEGVAVRLVAPAYPQARGDIDTWRIPSRRLPFDPEDRLMRRGPLRQTTEQLAAEGVDLIHIHTPFAAHYAGVALARKYRLPVVATYHTHFEEYIQHYLPVMPRPLLKAMARRLARHQCDALNAVIVPSEAMKTTLSDYGVMAPMHVLPTGIPIGQFASGNGPRFRATYAIHESRPMALYVGRVAHEKNIGFLLEAMTYALWRLPELLMVIAGEGPALPSLQRKVSDMGLSDHVRFVGYLDRKHALPDCYAAADVFTFASRTETQGLVLLEAMAAGLPVYALAHLGTTTIVEPGRGAVAASDDAEAFGRGLAELAADRQRLTRLARDGRRFANEWSAPQRARQLAALYQAIVV